MKKRWRTGEWWREEREGEVRASTIQQGESMKMVLGRGDGMGGGSTVERVVMPMAAEWLRNGGMEERMRVGVRCRWQVLFICRVVRLIWDVV